MLYGPEDLPLSRDQQGAVEVKMVFFRLFLLRATSRLLSVTIDSYVGHVASYHTVTGGTPFHEVVPKSERALSIVKTIKARRPSSSRGKTPFEHGDYVTFDSSVSASLTAFANAKGVETRFRCQRVVTAVAVMKTALLRLSEIAQNKHLSIANRSPILVTDLRFFTHAKKGAFEEVFLQCDGTLPVAAFQLAMIKSRMPPSKADPVQRSDNDLTFPAKVFDEDPDGAMEHICRFIDTFPVPEYRREAVPLFRRKINPSPAQFHRYDFKRDFRWVCRNASPELQYKQWGTHAFRIGGLNALQDAGASVAECMALGRWRSDAWKLYSRRNRPRLVEWTRWIMRTPPAVDSAGNCRGTSDSSPDGEWEDTNITDAEDSDSDSGGE